MFCQQNSSLYLFRIPYDVGYMSVQKSRCMRYLTRLHSVALKYTRHYSWDIFEIMKLKI